MKREDIFFIVTPFIMTGLFLVFGYSVLVSQTPEARIGLNQGETTIEFLEESDIESVPPQVDFSAQISGPIVSVPKNRAELQYIFDTLVSDQTNTIYISVPITMKSDREFVLTDAASSNEENVMRWTEKLISQAHQQGYHVILGLTINAASTVQDPAVFAPVYGQFVEKWATLANESSVTALIPGITIGHPLYSQVTPADMDKILATIQTKIRQKYLGFIGVNLCCTTQLESNLNQFGFINVIPTPEFPFIDLEVLARQLEQNQNLDFVTYYDRDRNQVTYQMP